MIGQNVDQANQVLDAKGFDVAIKAVPSGAPRNQVVEQDPIPTDRGGGKAEEGSTVTLSVSSGPAIVSVPTVANLSEAEARKRLENAGFKVNTQERVLEVGPPRAGDRDLAARRHSALDRPSRDPVDLARRQYGDRPQRRGSE